MFHIADLCSDANGIICGTSGGLLAFDSSSEMFSTWTNTDGLATNDITAVADDAFGRIWIGYQNGWIQRFDPTGENTLFVDDFEGHGITCFFLSNDTLFVGSDIGVSVYLIDRGEVKETYRRLGDFQVDIPVRDILLFQNQLWVGTEEGIAAASLDAVNLLDPQSWTNYTTAQGLPNNSITTLEHLDARLYAGTAGGVAFLDNEFTTINTGFASTDVIDLTAFDETMYALCSTGVCLWDGQSWNRVGSVFTNGTVAAADDNDLWIGTEQGILRYASSSDSWESFLPDTPPENRFIDMILDQDGTLWCCSSAAGGTGFYAFDGTSWERFQRADYPEFPSDDAVSVAVDPFNQILIGTHGGGIIHRLEDGSFQFYNPDTGYLAGIQGFPSYAVVWDMVFDDEGTLWIVNRDALTRLPLISVLDDTWTYYGNADGISTGGLKVLALDASNRVWIGSHWESAQGVYILDPAGTPSDKSDDPVVERITTSDGLESNEITAIAPDRTGGVWIGTPLGLHYYFGGSVIRRYGLPSDNITALAVDGADNLWVGTGEGLSYFSSISYSWAHFTSETSDLVSNDILSLFFDNASGILYIGTNHGLSRLSTPFSEPTESLIPLSIYPNPFIPGTHERVIIDNLARDVAVSIYTASGFLVRRFLPDEIQGRRLTWTGRTDTGEAAAGGIYIVITTAEDGQSTMVKFALVR